MRHVIVKFTWILIVTVDTWRGFARLVHFLLHVRHICVVQRIRSPLVFRRSQVVLVDHSVICNNYTFTHSAREGRAISLRNHLTMLSNNCTLIVVLEIPAVDDSILSLRVALRNRCHHRLRCPIHWVASTVCNINCSMIATWDYYRVVFILLMIVMELNFLMNSLFRGVV